jgi:hypothetical protein
MVIFGTVSESFRRSSIRKSSKVCCHEEKRPSTEFLGLSDRWGSSRISGRLHFTKDPETIAKKMASKEVSPKGLGSAIRMVQYFINRGGKDLSAARKRKLEAAKRILQERNQQEKARAK